MTYLTVSQVLAPSNLDSANTFPDLHKTYLTSSEFVLKNTNLNNVKDLDTKVDLWRNLRPPLTCPLKSWAYHLPWIRETTSKYANLWFSQPSEEKVTKCSFASTWDFSHRYFKITKAYIDNQIDFNCYPGPYHAPTKDPRPEPKVFNHSLGPKWDVSSRYFRISMLFKGDHADFYYHPGAFFRGDDPWANGEWLTSVKLLHPRQHGSNFYKLDDQGNLYIGWKVYDWALKMPNPIHKS